MLLIYNKSENIDYKSFVLNALRHYSLSVSKAELIRHNENITFDILAEEGHFVLRIRKPRENFSLGVFETDISQYELFESEVDLLHHLNRQFMLPFQEPIKNRNGGYITNVCGYPACLLRFIEGQTLSRENVDSYAEELGVLAFQIHNLAQGFSGKRYVYSHLLIKNLKNEMVVAKSLAHISHEECEVCIRSLDAIDSVMTRLDREGLQLIHSDMGLGNILKTNEGLTAIDFSLSGYGYRAMECGMIASNFSTDEAIERMRHSYIKSSGFDINRYDVDAFFAWSVMMFIACQHGRYYQEEWFKKRMRHWTEGCIEPSNWINDIDNKN